jgi:hypothetical protein
MRLSDSSNSRRFRLAVLFVLMLPVFILPLDGSGPVDTPSAHDQGCFCTSCEPLLPLELALRPAPGDPALPGTALEVVLTARADLPSVRLELVLPERATLVAGPRELAGALVRGEQSVVSLQVTGDGPFTVKARATAVTDSGLSFRRGAAIELGRQGLPQPAAAGRLVRTAGGRTVREFPAGGPAAVEGLP